MIFKAGRYLVLNPAERRQFMRAFIDLAVIDIGLRIFGFWNVVRRARPASREIPDVPDLKMVHRARQYARQVDRAARHHVVRADCLQRSLVLHHWLRREGWPSELRIGVRKDKGELKAHAWVELGCSIVNDHPASVAAFTPLMGASRQQAVWDALT